MNNKELNLIIVIAAATMLVASVVVEALFDDADALRKKGKKSKKSKADFTVPEPVLIPVSLPNPSILNQLA